MKIKGLSTVVLIMVAVLGVAGVASALPDPPFPWGTNPKTAAPVNSFCDAQQAIVDNSLISMLPPEFSGFISFLAPGTGDLNGTSFVIVDPTEFALTGNGMLDCSIELRLIEEVLKDTAFNVNGLTHSAVMTALNANDARFLIDVGLYWTLAPSLLNGLAQVLHGHTLIGDGTAVFSDPVTGTDPIEYNRIDVNGSWAFIEALGYALKTADIFTNAFAAANYTRMPQYFSKQGDADGDGATNDCEYRIYGAGAYPANALNPAMTPTTTECNALPVFEFGTVTGAGWYEAGIASITLGVTVTGETGTVTFAWSKDGGTLGGQTTNTLTLNSPTEADSGVYRCTATDQSKAAIVAVIPVTVGAADSLPVTSLAGLAAMVVLAGTALVLRRRVKA